MSYPKIPQLLNFVNHRRSAKTGASEIENRWDCWLNKLDWSQILHSSDGSQKWAAFAFWPKNFEAAGGHFGFLWKMDFWASAGRRVTGPPKSTKITVRHLLELSDNNIEHKLLKILRIMRFKKGRAKSAPPQWGIVLSFKFQWSFFVILFLFFPLVLVLGLVSAWFQYFSDLREECEAWC